MNQNEKWMLRLLRAALWSEPVDGKQLPADADWMGVLDAAGYQAVEGLVASALYKALENEDLSPSGDEALHRSVYDVVSTNGSNQHLNDALRSIVTLLCDEGYHPVLIKGQGIGQCYDQPNLRSAGDIDLYLGEDEVARFMAEQRPLYEDGTYDASYDKHFSFFFDGVDIELHRYVINRDHSRTCRTMQQFAARELSGERLTEKVIDGFTVTTPSAVFDTVYTFYHLWQHFLRSGVGLRHLCDMARCLHVYHERLDPAALEALLREARLLHAWRVFVAFLVRYLGLPTAEAPLYRPGYDRATARLLAVVLRNGNLGKAQDKRITAGASAASADGQGRGALSQKLHSMGIYFRHWIDIYPIDPHGVRLQARRYLADGLRRVFLTTR